LAEKSSKHYDITDLIGKAYLKSATAAVACFPANFTYLMDKNLEESERNVMSCLLDNPVPCTRIAEEPPTYYKRHKSTDPNQQSLRLPHETPLLLSCP
jgi:hypothetical protein